MQPASPSESASYSDKYYPLHLALLTVGENMMPIGHWTVISKDPFRFLICMAHGNFSLDLLREHKEAAIHFMPWSEREKVVRAGWISGRDVNKAERLGFSLLPAEKLEHTKLIDGADSAFETVVISELPELSREFVPTVLEVVHVHGGAHEKPIIYLSRKDYATLGDDWRFQK